VIGDIHGGLKALIQIFENGMFNSKDTFIFLGDYVDGWSESAQVIQFLIKLKKRYNCIFLRGNHDEWLEEWLFSGIRPHGWEQNGGTSTIESYIESALVMNDEHKKFFKNLHNYYVDDKNRLFVHGGFTSNRGAEKEHVDSYLRWDRSLWYSALAAKPTYDKYKNLKLVDKRLRNYKEIFIGHTATTSYSMNSKGKIREQRKFSNETIITPINACNVWNMDTGCGFKGKLTCMNVDTKEYVQSDFLTELYKNEKGRN